MPRNEARAVATSCCWPMVKRAEHRTRRQVEADIVKDALGLARHVLLAHQPVAGLLLAEEHVGGDRQVAAKQHFLVDGVDAVIDRLLRIGQARRLAFPQDLAAGSTDDAGQKLDQGGFAGAVLADDRVDLAALERQASPA